MHVVWPGRIIRIIPIRLLIKLPVPSVRKESGVLVCEMWSQSRLYGEIQSLIERRGMPPEHRPALATSPE